MGCTATDLSSDSLFECSCVSCKEELYYREEKDAEERRDSEEGGTA